MSPEEITGVILNIAGVWLTARRNVLCWPVGIAGVLIYAVLFFRWKLYADMVLQCLYVLTQIYGWYQWRREEKSGKTRIRKQRLSFDTALIHLTLTLLFCIGTGALMIRFTDDPMPRSDALLTGYSLLASVWAAKRFSENWILWLLVDAGYIALFILRDDLPTTVLYCAFEILAVYGLISWRNLPEEEPQRK